VTFLAIRDSVAPWTNPPQLVGTVSIRGLPPFER
jgi:hypothetical protein